MIGKEKKYIQNPDEILKKIGLSNFIQKNL